MSIVFDTPEQINVYVFLSLYHAAKFRVKTGMSMVRMQEIKAANSNGWSNKRTIKGVLADLEEIHKELNLS